MDAVVGEYSSVPTGINCREFMNGSCRFGTRCLYRHEWPVMPSTVPCRYFQKGGCWYGERCRYLHVRQPDGGAAFTVRRGSAADIRSSLVGNVFSERRGSEPALPRIQGISSQGHRGSESALVNVSNLQHNFGHLTTDISGGPPLPQQEAKTNPTAPQESVQRPETAQAGTAYGVSQQTSSKETTERCGGGAAAASADQNETEAVSQSRNVTCGICMDLVYEKADAHERRFGILPNCSHSFCLGCIVTWRKTKSFEEEVVKACPQCRVKSAFYVPSKYWVEGRAKETLIAAFKEKCNKRTCSFFMRFGRCPFKSECIYRHVTHRRRPPRHSSFDEESLEDLDSLKLLDYIMALTLLNDFFDDDDDEGDFDDELYFYLGE